MHVGLSALLPRARRPGCRTQHLLRSQELGEHTGLPQNPYRWRVAMARIREAEGDLDGALDLLDEAERLYVGDFSPNVRPVPAMRARVWIAQGRLATRSAGRVSRACPSTTTSATCASSSTSPWPGCCLADSDRTERMRARAPGAPAPSGGGGRADGQRHRDPGAAGARPPGARRHRLALWCRWSAPWRWPSRRATSASSSTRARRMAALLEAAAERGIVPDYVRRLLDRRRRRRRRPQPAGRTWSSR